ncbi:hypothetical protein DFJ74DRAFT_750049 [Hyaloraphidium curvatum]|nr:hypothetical protein DFJ74DRAFT_750049 [Hyaloraphidium curvatum]
MAAALSASAVKQTEVISIESGAAMPEAAKVPQPSAGPPTQGPLAAQPTEAEAAVPTAATAQPVAPASAAAAAAAQAGAPAPNAATGDRRPVAGPTLPPAQPTYAATLNPTSRIISFAAPATAMSLLEESHLMKCGAPAKLPDSAFGAGAPYLPRLHDAPMVALDLGRGPENMSLHMAQSLVGPVLKTCLGVAADARFTWVAKLRFGPNGYPWLYLIPTEGSPADRDQFVKTLEDQKFLPIKLRSGTDWRIRIVKTLREHDLLVHLYDYYGPQNPAQTTFFQWLTANLSAYIHHPVSEYRFEERAAPAGNCDRLSFVVHCESAYDRLMVLQFLQHGDRLSIPYEFDELGRPVGPTFPVRVCYDHLEERMPKFTLGNKSLGGTNGRQLPRESAPRETSKAPVAPAVAPTTFRLG